MVARSRAHYIKRLSDVELLTAVLKIRLLAMTRGLL